MSRRIVAFHQRHEKGLFAQLTDCVLISKACEERGIEPYFFLETRVSFQEGMSRNSLSYYFAQPNLTEEEARQAYADVLEGNCIVLQDRYDINRFWAGNPAKEIINTLTSVEAGRRLFQRNLALQPNVMSLADAFSASHFNGRRILGVHYRGTDKRLIEADPMDYGEVFKVVRNEFKNGYEGIFLATDESSFAEYMVSSAIGRAVFWRALPETDRSHYELLSNNFQKGLEAILDWMLLARSAVLIKTPSLLSAWCQVLNPALRVIPIGRPRVGDYIDGRRDIFGYWPESCLHTAKADSP